jgi:hypothetical protein
MRRSDIKLTMSVYTDLKLLDVAGALDALPDLPLDRNVCIKTAAMATGTDGGKARPPALLFAQTSDNSGTTSAITDNLATGALPTTVAVSGCADKKKDPLTTAASGSACRGDRRWTFPNDLPATSLFWRSISHTEEFSADSFYTLAERTAI